jgi:hypothetical protein|tara:strand:- start:21 stop:401 length:381 start_codon:yes stop_codon:yes gene_type:complete
MSNTNYFTETFDTHARHGDTTTTEVEGFTFTAHLTRDYDTTPMEFECYDVGEIDSWKRDEWSFCNVVLTAARRGISLDTFSACLGGVEMNFPGSDNAYLTQVAGELLDEALPDARTALAKIKRKLS